MTRTPKEPSTIEECLLILREQARADPGATFMTLLDQLVDLACAGGSLVPNPPIHAHVKLRFYKTVVARLAKAGVLPADPDDREPGPGSGPGSEPGRSRQG